RRDELFVVRTGIAKLIPHHAALRIVAVGCDLHGGPRAVLVEPTDGPHELFLPAVAPELELIGRIAVHAELAGLATLHPFGPRVTEKIVLEQAEVVLAALGELRAHALRTVAFLGKDHLIAARWKFAM